MIYLHSPITGGYYLMTGDQLDDDVNENFEDFMRSCADKALNFFDVLRDTPGVWDIFVTKQVEVCVQF
jgi:hypothetical protein